MNQTLHNHLQRRDQTTGGAVIGRPETEVGKPDFALLTPDAFGQYLHRRLEAFLSRIEASEAYRSVFSPDAKPEYVGAVIKYVLLEVFSYGPHVTEATFTAIGRFPKKESKLMEKLALHDAEEADHGEMALADAAKLGLDEDWARLRRITPESFAMGAAVRLIATQLSPFAYLGYMYPFEALTPILTERLQKVLVAKRFPSHATRFVDYHAVADIGHAAVLRKLIEEIVQKYPEAAADIDYAFDIFTCVYPVPIWERCVESARTELGLSS
jgi:hypothetical protein